MNRMTQFKEKAGSTGGKCKCWIIWISKLDGWGRYTLYKATHVPGDDQKQHLELSRDTVAKNLIKILCKDFFPIPEPLIQKQLSRAVSLRDGKKK